MLQFSVTVRTTSSGTFAHECISFQGQIELRPDQRFAMRDNLLGDLHCVAARCASSYPIPVISRNRSGSQIAQV